jgi:FAD/FMN-containing dehydrogenase
MSAHLIEALAAIVGPDRCLSDQADMAFYLRDWRGIYVGRAMAVALPSNTGEIQRLLAWARDHRIAVVPQGGNTGLSGAATPDESGHAVVLSLRRMNKVRTIDPLDNTMVVEAGCILADVQAAADAVDRLFPLSLAAEGSCTIGGNIATNAGGINVLRYGTARELTLGLEAVLADGSLFSDLKTLRKDNTGYDLKQLLIGSEGTLGIITAASLKLFPKPKSRATALAALTSLKQAPALLSRCRAASADQLVSFELLPRLGFELAQGGDSRRALPLDPLPDFAILMELATSAEAIDLGALLESCLSQAMHEGEISNAVIAKSAAQSHDLWGWREGMVEAQHRLGPGIKHDVALPLAKVPDYILTANALLGARYPEARVLAFGHLGDGNIHYNLLQMPDMSGDRLNALTAAVNRDVHDLVEKMGGSISAEHGIGQLRRLEFQSRVDPLEMRMMQGVKKLLDPLGIMNPGKVL